MSQAPERYRPPALLHAAASPAGTTGAGVASADAGLATAAVTDAAAGAFAAAVGASRGGLRCSGGRKERGKQKHEHVHRKISE